MFLEIKLFSQMCKHKIVLHVSVNEIFTTGLEVNSVKTIYWSGDFLERLFLFDPSLTSGMSAALMQGHFLRRRPDIKQHMSGGREFHRQLPPHFTRHETLNAPGLE